MAVTTGAAVITDVVAMLAADRLLLHIGVLQAAQLAARQAVDSTAALQPAGPMALAGFTVAAVVVPTAAVVTGN
jgi:hypothetical protein